MTAHSLRLGVGVLGFAVALAAQTTIQVPATPVKPGVTFQVVLTNRTTICIDISRTNVLTLLRPTGELIAPFLVGCGPVGTCLANGRQSTLRYATPATGPGSAGSYVLLCPYGSGAAARLDVVAPTSPFPDLHVYPRALPHGPGGYRVPGPPAPGNEWEFANTAARAWTISPLLRVFAPGGTRPLTSLQLTPFTVPAGGVRRVSLPLQGLAAGPYTVETSWYDPGLRRTVTVRQGIVLTSGVTVDLHLPAGKVVPRGGSLPVVLTIAQGSARPGPPWPYFVAVGYAPGTMVLPGGVRAPLALDSLVLLSLRTGLFGLLQGNVGFANPQGIYCAHAVTFFPVATGIRIRHPGAELSGLRLRVGTAALVPGTNRFVVSQPEEIVLQ